MRSIERERCHHLLLLLLPVQLVDIFLLTPPLTFVMPCPGHRELSLLVASIITCIAC